LLASCGQSATPAPLVSTTIAAGDVVLSSIRGTDPGGSASATVAAPPNTRCTIVYTTPDNRIMHLPGLGPKGTDAHGKATWTWYVATNTARGIGTVAITCGGITRSERILIGVGE
ncbi:MAG: hypothetical protein M3Y58_18735, partial [Chloroflexota bacterium]|nr:hypothetical protein [Chloroflexota bacterium]